MAQKSARRHEVPTIKRIQGLRQRNATSRVKVHLGWRIHNARRRIYSQSVAAASRINTISIRGPGPQRKSKHENGSNKAEVGRRNQHRAERRSGTIVKKILGPASRSAKAPEKRPLKGVGSTLIGEISYRKKTIQSLGEMQSIKIWVRVQGIRARALIDSGSMFDAVSRAFVHRHQLATQTKHMEDRYQAIGADGLPLRRGQVNEEVHTNVRLGPYQSQEQLDIIETTNEDVILGPTMVKESQPKD